MISSNSKEISGAAFASLSGSAGTGINDQGQVVLTAQIDNGPDTMLLLTPKSPAGSPAP